MNRFLLSFRFFLKRLVWLIPFAGALVGYYAMARLLRVDEVEVPAIVGSSLEDALALLGPCQLGLKLLAEKIDATVPEGTITEQRPAAGKKVRPHQSVLVVVARQPEPDRAPLMIGLCQQDAQAKATKLGIKVRCLELESMLPSGRCLAQSPEQGEPIEAQGLTLYFSGGVSPWRVMPSLQNRSLADVVSFLELFSIKPKIFGLSGDFDGNSMVVDQRPLPGSIINIKKMHTVYLQVQAS